jgi:hypothetical protein
MIKRRAPWFKAAMVAGFLLGVLLLVGSVANYHSVTSHLVPDHLNRLAGQYVSRLETHARQQNAQSRGELQEILEQLHREQSGNIAWIRTVNQQGALLAASGDPSGRSIPEESLQTLLEVRAQSVSETISAPNGEVLVVTMPFRFRLMEPGAERGGRPSGRREGVIGSPAGAGAGRPRFNIAEVSLYLHGTDDPFQPLRRNLVVSILAALALLGSMIILFLRLPSYLHGRQLEQQLAVARRVQQELLPHTCPTCERLDFSAECLPAWEVGGDYYDILPTGNGQIGLVLGDVSGKGLPAALLMGLLHGAVRAYSGLWNGANQPEITKELNELLRARTTSERFVSLFWAYYDPHKHLLHYVNAGHLPPLLARRGADGESEIQRLEKGGPVLGLLPKATYEQGEVALREGDLLVLYSDGVVEATNSSNEEFGEERLIQAVEANWQRSAAEIQGQILQEVTSFAGHKGLEDDLTLLVARVGAQGETGEHEN